MYQINKHQNSLSWCKQNLGSISEAVGSRNLYSHSRVLKIHEVNEKYPRFKATQSHNEKEHGASIFEILVYLCYERKLALKIDGQTQTNHLLALKFTRIGLKNRK